MANDKPHLRAVGPDETPAPKPPKSITEALSGSSQDVMVAMRHALAKKLDAGEVSSNAIASAYKELRELDRLIRIEDEARADTAATDGSAYVDRPFDASAI